MISQILSYFKKQIYIFEVENTNMQRHFVEYYLNFASSTNFKVQVSRSVFMYETIQLTTHKTNDLCFNNYGSRRILKDNNLKTNNKLVTSVLI